MKIKALDFNYCECGCKGYSASVPTPYQGYWIYWDLRGSFYLHLGHSWSGEKLGTFSSYADAEEAANHHFKPHALKILSKLLDNE